MVPPYSHRVSRVRRYSGYNRLTQVFAYVTITLCGGSSHILLLTLVNTRCCPNPEDITTFGLASSAFARHYLRNLGWFLFLALLRCFSSGGSLPMTIWFTIGWLGIAQPGFPIRKSTGQSLLSAHRGLSQIAASFVGSWCQGILLALFVAWLIIGSLGICILDDN